MAQTVCVLLVVVRLIRGLHVPVLFLISFFFFLFCLLCMVGVDVTWLDLQWDMKFYVCLINLFIHCRKAFLGINIDNRLFSYVLAGVMSFQ